MQKQDLALLLQTLLRCLHCRVSGVDRVVITSLQSWENSFHHRNKVVFCGSNLYKTFLYKMCGLRFQLELLTQVFTQACLSTFSSGKKLALQWFKNILFVLHNRKTEYSFGSTRWLSQLNFLKWWNSVSVTERCICETGRISGCFLGTFGPD